MGYPNSSPPSTGDCPLCGGPLPGGDLKWLPESRVLAGERGSAHLSKYEARLFDAIWNARGRDTGLHRTQLMDVCYRDDPDGGPTDTAVVGVRVAFVNRKLAALGLRIKGHKTVGYRLLEMH